MIIDGYPNKGLTWVTNWTKVTGGNTWLTARHTPNTLAVRVEVISWLAAVRACVCGSMSTWVLIPLLTVPYIYITLHYSFLKWPK